MKTTRSDDKFEHEQEEAQETGVQRRTSGRREEGVRKKRMTRREGA